MSFSNPPPGVSLGALRILKPDIPKEGDEPYSTELHAPTFSTGLLKRSDVQLQVGGQHAVPADVAVLSPPEQTDLRPPEQSTDLSEHHNPLLVEAFSGGVISDVMHQKKSSIDFANLDGNQQAPEFSDIKLRSPSSALGSSTHNTEFQQRQYSFTGDNFFKANKQFNEFPYDDKDLDFAMLGPPSLADKKYTGKW